MDEIRGAEHFRSLFLHARVSSESLCQGDAKGCAHMLLACSQISGMLLLRLCSSGNLDLKLAAQGSALSRSCLSLLLQLHLCQHTALCLRKKAFPLYNVLTGVPSAFA